MNLICGNCRPYECEEPHDGAIPILCVYCVRNPRWPYSTTNAERVAAAPEPRKLRAIR